jgi:hypothetical protein
VVDWHGPICDAALVAGPQLVESRAKSKRGLCAVRKLAESLRGSDEDSESVFDGFGGEGAAREL